MTREEAIIVLKAFMENPLFSNVHKAAFNIAIHDIKAHHDWDINNLILINKDNYEPLEQEPQTFKWCTDCREYDQEKHCCHRWSKVIRDTVEEMKQEPIKPMVEIDLYSVIKQKYIEREVLDKIREQMKDYLRGVEITLEVLVENDPLRLKMEGAKDTLEECLELIDKAESEAGNGMTIDDAIKYYSNKNVVLTEEEAEANTIALNTMRKYQMFQDQSLSLYMERLKADMVAMLTELQLEIEEIEIDVPFGFEPVSKTSAFYEGVSASSRLIQEKINALKENTDGTTSN